MQNKPNIGSLLRVAILFVLFSAAAFLIPLRRGSMFWCEYLFTAAAFAVWAGAALLAQRDAGTLKERLYSVPTVTIAVIYTVLQAAAFFLFCLLPVLHVRIAAVISCCLLGAALIGILTADHNSHAALRDEAADQDSYRFLKQQQINVEMLAARETDPAIRSALQKLAEDLRCSAPRSAGALAAMENEIAGRIAGLSSVPDKAAEIHEISLLLTERNKAAVMLKGT